MNTTELHRYPVIANDPLKAWNAADELIIEHFSTIDLKGKRVLVIGDNFGAITSNLIDGDLTFYSDSYISHQAAKLNIKRDVFYINQLQLIDGNFDYIIMQIPKNYSFLEDILSTLTSHVHSESMLIATSMIKHLGNGAFDAINRIFGDTSTSLAKKKARLVFAKFCREESRSNFPLEIQIDGFNLNITNHSNVFSREKLDIGTRFFLKHIPTSIRGNILDMGCGNGLLGIQASLINPQSDIWFCDESQMALLSARENFTKLAQGNAHFVWSNCFEGHKEETFDLVVCNPPFHQGHTIGDFVAQQMFKDAKLALKAGARLRVIGNSHLGYHIVLKQLFGNVSKVDSNKKFTIWDCIK
jgi:16S rRNA G1207 methylase RsmC